MAGFAVESEAAAKSSRRACEELVGAGANWDHTDPAVKQELRARLIAFEARLPPGTRAPFDSRMQDLKRDVPDLAAIAEDVLKS